MEDIRPLKPLIANAAPAMAGTPGLAYIGVPNRVLVETTSIAGLYSPAPSGSRAAGTPVRSQSRATRAPTALAASS